MSTPSAIPARPIRPEGSAGEVFLAFLRLGLTAFGGPVAHLGFFREAFVLRRKWLTDQSYADVVALCQFLPGPASSQVGMVIGLQRAGLLGLLAAWAAFTLPSAVLLVLFAFGAAAISDIAGAGWLSGLKAAAVGVVAHAVLGMAQTLAPDKRRATIAVGGMIVVLLLPGAPGQIAVIAAAAMTGLLWLRPATESLSEEHGFTLAVSRKLAIACLALFGLLLLGLPLAAVLSGNTLLQQFEIFYRAGALVFGGGHVVLPLLEADLVRAGLVSPDMFLAGYGAAQAVPGPLFTFAAFLGAASPVSPGGLAGAALALVGIFLPSALLVIGALPFWQRLRHLPLARRALLGTNAGVVGLLAAALYTPVFTAGVTSAITLGIAAAAFTALAAWKVPAWAVVLAAAALGALLL